MKRKFFHPISKRFGVFGLVLTVLLTMVMIVANVALSRYSNTISSTLDLNKQISAGGDEATYQKARNLTQEIAGEGATCSRTPTAHCRSTPRKSTCSATVA